MLRGQHEAKETRWWSGSTTVKEGRKRTRQAVGRRKKHPGTDCSVNVQRESRTGSRKEGASVGADEAGGLRRRDRGNEGDGEMVMSGMDGAKELDDEDSNDRPENKHPLDKPTTLRHSVCSKCDEQAACVDRAVV
eukprot:6172075-Pleurochrysis_carterae.AAC.3